MGCKKDRSLSSDAASVDGPSSRISIYPEASMTKRNGGADQWQKVLPATRVEPQPRLAYVQSLRSVIPDFATSGRQGSGH